MNEKIYSILLIEDEADHRELICRSFKRQNEPFKIIIAKTLKEAYSFINNDTNFDIVISDLCLPDGKGIDLLLEQNQQLKFPFILMTSQGDEKVAVQAIKAGALDYVIKSEITMMDMPRVVLRTLREWNHIIERKHAEEMLQNKAISLEKANQELKNTMEQLIQSEKLSAIGEMSASVAHELSQPLNSIKIISQSIVRDIEKERFKIENINRDIKDIISQVNKMADIIDHMRVYTRRTEFNTMKLANINTVIETSLKFFKQQLINHDIELNINLQTELPKIFYDPIRIEQVLVNLINNAKDALKNSGKNKKSIEIKTYGNSRDVVIEVKDNGLGISEDLQQKIFQPFFTTKPPGKGTGLGLHVAIKIIEEHKGKIEVYSKVGEETIFKIILPVQIERNSEM
ncbi:MAG: response regulator [Desulfobacterales bacterium]|nr:response regulator [Desulfobacterales bacterium]